MRIKCITNLAKDLPEKLIQAEQYKIDLKFDLEINKTYTVYAVLVMGDCIWYSICDGTYIYYPLWHPSPLFTIEEGSFSKFWKMKIPERETIYKESLKAVISYQEWLDDPYYYSDLVDGKSENIKIFEKYKEAMDLEFPNPEINDKASDIEEGWVMCPYCIDAWQPNQVDAMIVCPKCSRVMHSPYYGK